MDEAGRSRAGFAALVVIGGAVAVFGVFLDWFTTTLRAARVGGPSARFTSSGVDGVDGKAALVAAVVAVLAGVLMWVWSGRRKHVVLGTMALVGGLVAAGLSGFDALTAKDRAIRAYASDLARRTHAPEATALSAVRRLFDLGILRVSLATGIFLVLAGGAAAALAAAFSLGRSVEGLETEATTNSFASA